MVEGEVAVEDRVRWASCTQGAGVEGLERSMLEKNGVEGGRVMGELEVEERVRGPDIVVEVVPWEAEC